MNSNPLVTATKTFDSNGHVSPLKKAIRPAYLTTQDQVVTVPLVALPNIGQATQLMTVSQDFAAEPWKLSGVATGDDSPPNLFPRVLVNIYSPQLGWNLMNNPIHWACMIGSGARPHPLYTSLFLAPTQSLQWTFYNFFEADDIDLSVSAHGRGYYYQKYADGPAADETVRITNSLASKRTFPYWMSYKAPSINGTDNIFGGIQLTGTARRTVSMLTPYQGFFEVKYITCKTQHPFRWTMFDAWSGQFFLNANNNAPLDSRNTTGTAELPYELEEPLLIGPNSQITMNFFPITTTTVFLTLCGRIIRSQEYV